MFVDHAAAAGGNFSVHLNDSVVSDYLQTAAEAQRHYVIGVFLSSLYAVLLFPVGFIGNILILVVNLDHRGHLAGPDLYFVNLAAADLALVADSLIEVFNLRRGYFERGAGLCILMNLFQQVNMYSSVFFLTWMSFDRFVALTGSVGRGRRGGGGMPYARLSCCLIWVSSSFLTVLPFAVAQGQHAGEPHFCFADESQVQWLEVTLGFLLPLVVLAVCYWRIARVLRHSQREERREPRRGWRRSRSQKAVRMIAAAVCVFFLCWLPENVFLSVHLLRGGGGATLRQEYPLTGHAVRLAAFSNSCLNPIIYSFLGATFQDKLRLFIERKIGWIKTNQPSSNLPGCLPTTDTRCSGQNTPAPSCRKPSLTTGDTF